jgi:hypothetical protein
MSKKGISFELKLDPRSIIDTSINKAELRKLIEYEVNQKILPTIDKGVSPVKGKRSFAKYKDKDKYPARKKQSNKPNLTLTGEMLSWYETKIDNKDFAVTVGIHSDAPQDVKDKANANQFGTTNSKGEVAIAARPFVPRQGEVYNAQIMVAIRKAFATVISNAFKRLRRK